MLNLEYYFQNITKGLVVILAVLISVTLRRKTSVKL
jgi:predicted ABC-type sugar transport system permease subunit